VRRVSGSNKDDDFQGTDFSYDDLGTRSLSKDNYAILGEEKVNGNDCWILEAKAKDTKAKISRRVSWIDKKTYVTHKGEYYDRQNRLQKTLICESIKQVKGYWTTQKLTMTNVQTNHKTVYEIKNLKYDEKVNESFFTVSALEREQVK
jgi:outer membrane lipoprotein-sorting protein